MKKKKRGTADALDRHVAREADGVRGLVLALGAAEPHEPRVVARAEDPARHGTGGGRSATLESS